MKKINCILCFRNFIQIGDKPTCPYCKKHIESSEFVKCRPIEEAEIEQVVNIGEEVVDLFPVDDAEVNDDSVAIDSDEGPKDEQTDTDDEDSHEESSE